MLFCNKRNLELTRAKRGRRSGIIAERSSCFQVAPEGFGLLEHDKIRPAIDWRSGHDGSVGR